MTLHRFSILFICVKAEIILHTYVFNLDLTATSATLASQPALQCLTRFVAYAKY